jgi:hypothetical protein
LTITRPLLAIRGLTLRRDWLFAQLQERPFERLAAEFAALCEDAERLEERAREGLVALVVLLAQRGREPWAAQLRLHAIEQGYAGLGRLLRAYPAPSSLDEDTRPVVTKNASGPTLGERKSLARRPERRCLERLLTDPHPHVIRQLLSNPHLTETDVIALLSLRPGRASTQETLAEFPDWLVRARVRMATIHCPATPSHIAVPLVSLLTRPELREIEDSPSTHVVLRATAQELLERHPPLGPADCLTVQ